MLGILNVYSEQYRLNYLLRQMGQQKNDGEIIPIEVKAGVNTKAKSLAAYIAKYKPTSAVKFSAKKYGKTGIIQTQPLYMVAKL